MPSGGTKTPITATFGSGRFDSVFAPTTALFSPGAPPVTPDPQPVRRIDFPAGVNLQWTPRAYEPFGFPALRSFANVELVRLAIETRKDQIERLDWSVRPKKGRKSRTDADERVRRAEKMLRKPDGVTPFATWLRPLIEDLLAIDAPAIERRRDRAGNLIGLEVVDGASIKILIDRNGRRPIAPTPAYQQIIKGRIWCDLTTDDLIYSPRNVRSNHLYGLSPVETVVVTVNTIMRRQAQQLAYFTEGNLPQGLINAPDGWTPDQIKEFQDWIDSRLSGNQAERAKLLWAPFGAKYQAFKDSPIKDDFDEWLARIICYAFSLPASPFVKQVNRATAQEDQDRALEEGLQPLLKWAKRIFDGVIQDDLGFYDLEFVWDTIVDIDPEKQAKIHDLYVKNGTMSINEVRDELGHDAITGGEEPVIVVGNDVIPISMLRDKAEIAQAAAENAATPQEDAAAETDAKGKPAAKGKAKAADTSKDKGK